MLAIEIRINHGDQKKASLGVRQYARIVLVSKIKPGYKNAFKIPFYFYSC